MKLKILYFAALADALATREETLDAPTTVRDTAQLRAWLAARGPDWAAVNAAEIRMAVNQTIAKRETLLNDGDEIAFFPPVTGG